MIKEELINHYFSARYLCFKYIVRMLANYIIPAEGVRQIGPEETFDWSAFFALIGELPLEFFSTRTVFTDVEGIQGAADLIESLGR